MWCPLLGQTTKRTRPSPSSSSLKLRSSVTGECSQRPPPSPERRTTLMRVPNSTPKRRRGISLIHSQSGTSSFTALLLLPPTSSKVGSLTLSTLEHDATGSRSARTSENSVKRKANFGECPLHALG